MSRRNRAENQHKIDFGKVIRIRRKQLRLSQEELGFHCELDRTYISGIERGVRNPTLLTIWRLANSLNTTPEKLFQLIEKEN